MWFVIIDYQLVSHYKLWSELNIWIFELVEFVMLRNAASAVQHTHIHVCHVQGDDLKGMPYCLMTSQGAAFLEEVKCA